MRKYNKTPPIKILLYIIMLYVCSLTAYASDTPTLSSKGILQVDADANGSVDAMFHSNDLTKILTNVTNGKTNLKTALELYNTYPALATSPTFAQLTTRVKQLTTVPADTYAVNTSTHKPFIKVNNKWYACDNYGVKTGTTAVTIPAENLLVYTAGSYKNITEGKALFVNRRLVLGDGTDNRNHYTSGYNAGYAKGEEDANSAVNPDSESYTAGFAAGEASAKFQPTTYVEGTVVQGQKIFTPKPPYAIYMVWSKRTQTGSANYVQENSDTYVARGGFFQTARLRYDSWEGVTEGSISYGDMSTIIWEDDGVTLNCHGGSKYYVYY